jgi:urea transporter
LEIPKQYVFHIEATLFSYSQVFFSKNRVLAVILLAATFLDPTLGLIGLISIVITNLIAQVLGFEKTYIRDGSYGFNSLLVGLGLGAYYDFSFPFFILLLISALITFLLTVAVSGVLSKYKLPYLSIPFVLALWSILLASRQFESLGITSRGVFLLNDLYQVGSNYLVNLYHWFNGLPFHEAIKIYLKSLGAIIFQFNIISGVIIAVGLIIASRIAFTTSVLSFLAAYGFYKFIGADISELNYSYIGFNYILSGIAIGAFFYVPSWRSYLWAILLVPAIVVITSSLGNLFNIVQLGIYSLPFNLVVITFLYVLKLRSVKRGLEEVHIQSFSPEKNLYEWSGNKKRYRNYTRAPIGLPVIGEWLVSQAHRGSITHKEGWQHAWDFVITDKTAKEFKDSGDQLEDYYCYDKPVIAPADGTVEIILDSVDDNPIGESNLYQNWGNSIVLNHGYKLYSQLSHLKKESITVKKGDNVKKGDIIAHCGNSGRSPQPHVHFQIQETPHIGSKTIEYPLHEYIATKKDRLQFNFFDYPEKNEKIRSIQSTSILKKAFHFIPGEILRFEVQQTPGPTYTVTWEIKTDIFNKSYIHCLESDSYAYYVNDGTLFYFTYFKGSRKSLLYFFYLGAYKILLTYDTKLEISDHIPLYSIDRSIFRYLLDFVAPFYQIMTGEFVLRYTYSDDELSPEKIQLESSAITKVFNRGTREIKTEIVIRKNELYAFTVQTGKQSIKATCID